jgi:amino acid adenylation domain-containing protein
MAVMKAGGACVNLDPAHPQARLETIVKDAQATVLLTNSRHANILANSNTLQTVAVTEDFISCLKGLLAFDLPSLTARNSAYVLFTSGSTGKPKGIVIEHGSLCSSSKAHGTRWGIGPGTRLLQFASYTFDVSCADIFTTLQRGGTICVPSDEQRMNDLAGAINQFQCNWAFLTPTVAALLPSDTIPSLRKLVLGGEASSRDIIAKWHSVLDLIVCYGPAEASVYCSGAPPATATSDPANLGPAIGALYWIADPRDPSRLTPLGCVGELLLEGPTLARHYLHDAEKTAQAFVTNPVWSPRPGSRFYRTGDLVRYNNDGTIRFVGRKDTQVKVRGQRVELGEIEHAIRLAMPTLAHVSVDAVQDPTHLRQVVVAFLHYSNRSGPVEIKDMSTDLHDELNALQRILSQQLPSYMIPSMFIPLSRVPLTMNGKSDRRQLRELVTSLSREDSLAFSLASNVKLEPTTPMEVQLRALWAKVLHVDEDTLGKNHHFLRSGGDSISAIKLTSHARSTGLTLTVQDIFQAPVLEEMAAAISRKLVQDLPQQSPSTYTAFSLIDDISQMLPMMTSATKTSPENIEDILPASDFQSSAIAHSMQRTHGLVNYLFLDGEGEAPWTLAYVQKVWTVFIQAHGVLRTVFAAYGDRFYQVVLKETSQNIAWYQIDEDIESFCLKLCKQDVDSDLPLGSALTQLSVVSNEKHHRLILRLSHAQYDGVCLPRIWQSFQDAFSGRTPAPEITFSHFISSIYPVSEDAQAYWQQVLSNSTMTGIVAHSAPQYRNVYDLHLTRTVKIASQVGSGITFATILKASWALVLSSCSGSSDVVFGHVVSGRNLPQANIEQVIGPCLNILPTRVNIDVTATLNHLLEAVQAQHTSHMAHESLGTRTIVQKCSPWQPSTRMSSIVQHQNIDQDATVTLGDRNYLIGDFCPAADEADIAIKTTPLDNNEIDVLFITSSRSVGEPIATALLDRLCTTIQAICDSTHARVPVTQFIHSESILPLPSPSNSNGVNGHSASDCSIASRHRDATMVSAMYDSWREVLGNPDLSLSLESDFFAVGGDLVSIALLAAFWQCRGYHVAVEDLWDHSQSLGVMLDTLIEARC